MDEMKLPAPGPSPEGRRVLPANKKPLVAALCILGVLALAVGGILGWVYLYDGIYHGVSAGGVDLSGLSRAAALEALEEPLAGQSPGQSLDISVGEYSHSLDLSDVGL